MPFSAATRRQSASLPTKMISAVPSAAARTAERIMLGLVHSGMTTRFLFCFAFV